MRCGAVDVRHRGERGAEASRHEGEFDGPNGMRVESSEFDELRPQLVSLRLHEQLVDGLGQDSLLVAQLEIHRLTPWGARGRGQR